MPGFVERHDDYGEGRLRLSRNEDGDIAACIIDSVGNMSAGLEFVSRFHGGGRSPSTLSVLRALYEAMQEDEKEFPTHSASSP